MIIASMCTIPVRKNSFLQIVHRILYEQTIPIDQLHVWLNGYQQIDGNLPLDDRLIYHLEPSNPGPWVRYRAAEGLNSNDVFITLDDDLIYPPNYVEAGLAAMHRHPKSVLSFGGLAWSPLYDETFYGANRWNYMIDRSLSSDKIITILKGQGSFFPANLAQGLIQFLLSGFKTNDDMMVSYILQKRGVDILCAAHPGYWVLEQGDSNAAHALYRRDSSVRMETFSQMVTKLGFDPTAGILQQWKEPSERIVIFSDSCPPQPEFMEVEHFVTDLCGSDRGVHLVALAQGKFADRAQMFVDTPYILHPVFVPDSNGRFSWLLIVQSLREGRLNQLATLSIQNIRMQLKKKIQPTAVYRLSKGTLILEPA